jgi:hypothetical protein
LAVTDSAAAEAASFNQSRREIDTMKSSHLSFFMRGHWHS